MPNHMEHSLDDELLDIENQLSQLSPRNLPGDLLNRIDQLSGPLEGLETTKEPADGLAQLELHLGLVHPAALPDEMINRMSAAMDRWHQQPGEENTSDKILPFNGHQQKSKQAPVRLIKGNMWKAAAAVAVLGALSALLAPQNGKQGGGSTTAQAPTETKAPASVQNVQNQPNLWMASDSMSHNVTRTQDTGVVMARGNNPHRCIRVDYINRIKAKDADGREIEIKSPGVDYVLIPVETN